MPLKAGRYRIVQTSKGPVRLHFTESGRVNEAKNLKTGDSHSPAEFRNDRKKGKK